MVAPVDNVNGGCDCRQHATSLMYSRETLAGRAAGTAAFLSIRRIGVGTVLRQSLVVVPGRTETCTMRCMKASLAILAESPSLPERALGT